MWTYLLATVLVACSFGLAQAQLDICIQCDSATERSCVQPDGIALGRYCERPSNRTCFTRVFDRRVIRGCAVDLEESIRNNCHNETMCELCHGFDNCNAARFPLHRIFCHHCEGERVNSTCSGELDSVATVCEFYEPDDSCFIALDENNIRRGCVSSRDECRRAGACFTCNGVGCNFIDFNASVRVTSLNFAFITALAAVAVATSKMMNY